MLFGHQNDNTKQTDETTVPVTSSDNTSFTPAVSSGASLPLLNDDNTTRPALDQPTASTPSAAADLSSPAPASEDVLQSTPADELLSLKQQALEQLGPLVGHLEQSPEEKFRTTMMMIQSSDNQALIKDAYTAAQAIPDDKARAQALLDIVNEINYFTQQAQNS